MIKGKLFYIVTFFLILNFMSMTASAEQLMLTIDHTKIASPISDFPVLIHLGTSSGQNAVDTSSVFSVLGNDANRKKISVSTDSGGTQQLYVEIEKWDTANKQAWLWIKVPSVSSSTDTTLYLSYDPDMPDNTNYVGDIGEAPATKVWSNNFVAVYHFAEQGNGTAGEYKDSTGRGNDGRAVNAVRSTGEHPGKAPLRVPSKIGGGGYYDGGGSGAWPCIQIPDSDDFSITTTNNFTMSFWWNAASKTWKNAPVKNSDTFIHPIGKQKDYDSKAMEWQWVLESYPVEDDSPGVSRFYQFSPNAGYGAAADNYEPYGVNEWHYDTCLASCSSSTVGQADHWVDLSHNTGVTTWQEYGVNYKNGPAPVYVGTSTFEDLEELNNCFYGQIDELEFSNVSRSPAWIKASCYSGQGQLIKYTPANGSVPPIPLVDNKTYPVADFSPNVTTGVAPLSVQFTDLSQNADSWYWDFENDGKVDSTDRNPIHTYAAPGIYTVKLDAVNKNDTDSKLATITVSENSLPVLPVADFSPNVTTGVAPLSVQFTDLSQNADSWYWDFGDGDTSTKQNPAHKFEDAGTFKVTLTVSNTNGTNSRTTLISVRGTEVTLQEPVADFSSTVTSGSAPLSVAFTDKSSGFPTSWSWRFGDGTYSHQKVPIHIYRHTGEYTVRLTVKNDKGRDSVTKMEYIIVKNGH